MTLTEYNPQIYPFYLWVAKGADESLLDEFELEEEEFTESLTGNAITRAATHTTKGSVVDAVYWSSGVRREILL